MKLFLDTEFTGLHQKSTLISFALYADDSCYFYAELNDFDNTRISPWITENVISKLQFKEKKNEIITRNRVIEMKGNREEVTLHLTNWLKTFQNIEIWADVLAYDWVLFCELFGGALNVPENIFYAPFDLATLFRVKGMIEPAGKYEKDVKRFEFAGADASKQHHALEDARAEMACYEKLIKAI